MRADNTSLLLTCEVKVGVKKTALLATQAIAV